MRGNQMTLRHDTNSGKDPLLDTACPTPTDEKLPDGQYEDHWVLPEEERKKGFIRPVRHSYIHDYCKGVTRMGTKIAETYAREPTYYGSTFCSHCGGYFAVSNFIWDDGSNERVGS